LAGRANACRLGSAFPPSESRACRAGLRACLPSREEPAAGLRKSLKKWRKKPVAQAG
jgi:hypothetical protein